MKCPQCSGDDTKVLESREVSDVSAIRRRRHCNSCSARFTTYERIERPNLAVIKRNGERQLYDRTKLLAGILRACEKRSVSRLQLEEMINSIERELHECDESEVTSEYVGELVLDRLARIDPVAYIRFTSVYKDFTNLESFERELQRLKNKQKKNKII
ncbi:TPA: transcriptional repressor NrdR [Candidatus Saccharibacteria bacterium]|nr:transcriptional repressor NrdR [Candidatus Saccharibacteria bacterium]HIO87201.1 transcriptional repressor NrdR [Candidatus Saccharibacteria bacterium]